ncbi:4Fe-4S ferredoxin iron-sulfur binding domain protein [Pseudodesulfovibrio profundus]|uniref:4Fe-4S ferredoxin iron-sulfur binding domain protein n=1 Tax=Pseudodesulfovibrio profundus TaxID=57320 RepID=A0A2C8FD39_9BACT|nr:4Fe-4S dicluster domain-containing protein [Pseudodesulfovibrio profundus]SOB60407.1 4Fe-4S ferredoxin iron-sulfur binding domain protein [Pseudodesulfovibrio profundus]
MKKQYAFLVDAEKCIGCFTCAMACRNFYHQEEGVIWRQVYPLDEEIYPHRERAFFSLSCNHCEDPACLNVCPVKAYTKREEDGVVVHHQEKCIGCGNCIRSCPYGAPKYNPVEKRAEKCSLCHERLDAGLQPACTQSCPTDALQLIDLATHRQTSEVQYPAGYPKMKDLNPSTRFILPKLPKMVRR